jgi:hypothetical protein
MSALVRKSQLCLWFGRVKIPEGRLTESCSADVGGSRERSFRRPALGTVKVVSR